MDSILSTSSSRRISPQVRKTILFLTIIFCLSFLVLPNFCLAEEFHLISEEKFSCIGDGSCGLDDIMGIFINSSDLILGIVGSLALLMFVIGGVYWIVSAGDSNKVETGKKIMIGAVTGIIIVFGAFLMIKFLEDVLGVEKGFRPAEMQSTEQINNFYFLT